MQCCINASAHTCTCTYYNASDCMHTKSRSLCHCYFRTYLDLVICPRSKEIVHSILKVSSRDYIVSISIRRLIQDHKGRKRIRNSKLENINSKIIEYIIIDTTRDYTCTLSICRHYLITKCTSPYCNHCYG